jgi:hypothetical protein
MRTSASRGAAVDYSATVFPGDLPGPVPGAGIRHDDFEITETLVREVSEQLGQEPFLVKRGDDDGNLFQCSEIGGQKTLALNQTLLDIPSSTPWGRGSREGYAQAAIGLALAPFRIARYMIDVQSSFRWGALTAAVIRSIIGSRGGYP